MSITLTAFPAGFLINPQKSQSKLVELLKNNSNNTLNKGNELYEVKVLTNLNYNEMVLLFQHCIRNNINDCTNTCLNTYSFNNGLRALIEKDTNDRCNIIIYGSPDTSKVLKSGEDLFNYFDSIIGKNVRDINGSEYFYYLYKTAYKDISSLKKELRKNNVLEISQSSNNKLSAKVNGKDFRYFKNERDSFFTLELEQKINLMNIGIADSLSEVEIKTNIKPEELENLLCGTMYYFDKEKSEIKLNYGNTPVKFELSNGAYSLKFKSQNIVSVRNELEKLFVTMNKKAKRDLRLVNDKTYVNYAYRTNYTDKSVLINTLLEHGAKNLFEEDGNIYCDLYDMQMAYKRNKENVPFILEVVHVSDKGECESFIKDMNDEYGLNIQEITYRKIMERLKKENMNLESEEVTDDNSIVLTINVG